MRAHVLDRTGHGRDEWTEARIDALGIEGYIAEQLDPDAIDESNNDALNDRLAAYSEPDFITDLIGEQFVRGVYARRQLELHQRVNGLLGWLEDIQQPLVGADLELLARLLVHVRRTQHRETLDVRRQRDRARNARPGPLRGVHNLSRRLVQ